MAEHRGYTCDGGCGATLVLEPARALDSTTEHGWFHVLTPRGWPTLQACSVACAVRALEGQQAALPPAMRR